MPLVSRWLCTVGLRGAELFEPLLFFGRTDSRPVTLQDNSGKEKGVDLQTASNAYTIYFVAGAAEDKVTVTDGTYTTTLDPIVTNGGGDVVQNFNVKVSGVLPASTIDTVRLDPPVRGRTRQGDPRATGGTGPKGPPA